MKGPTADGINELPSLAVKLGSHDFWQAGQQNHLVRAIAKSDAQEAAQQ
jgi:hypothetical protein